MAIVDNNTSISEDDLTTALFGDIIHNYLCEISIY